MKNLSVRATALLLGLSCATVAYSQPSQPTATVPKLVRFSGSFRPANGMPAQPVESVTLSVYSDQAGGTALWQETQNVAVDGEGKYSALMGSTQNDGVPIELFASSEPRWLGVQFNRPGEPEQPRVLMTSVPYALKSVDAETLGGRPASAYLLAPAGTGTSSNLAGNSVSSVIEMVAGAVPASTGLAAHGAAPLKPRTISGQQGYIPVFTDGSNDLGDSVMQQSNGYIGVGTFPGANSNTTPSLDLRTYPFSQIGMAQTVDYLTFFASDIYGPAIYWDPTKDLRFGRGGNQLYGAFGFTEQMRIQSATGNVGIGTMTPGSTLDVNGNINFSQSVLWQGRPVLQLPGGLASGDLSVGPLSLSSASSGFGGNTAIGYSALSSNTTGSDNTSVGGATLTSNSTGSVNTALGYSALFFNSTGTGNTAGGAFALGNNTTGSSNTAIGTSAMPFSTSGNQNTAVGGDALYNYTTGSNNTAVGYQALLGGPVRSANTGVGNTAVGLSALLSNTSGGDNTAIGEFALQNNTTGSSNIAIGFSTATNVSGGNSNNIHIANQGSAADNGTIRIGTPGTQTSFFAAGVNGVNLGSDANAVPVVIDTSTGQLGVGNSSAGGGIAGVTAGIDLLGGGTSGTVTLNLDTTKVPTLAGTNNFTGPNTFTGPTTLTGPSVFTGTLSGASLAVTGNVGIGTQTPVAKLEVNGSVQADGNLAITTLGNGLIFPDGSKQTTAGLVTSVTAGMFLTGGGTGAVTLNLDTTRVPTLAGPNNFFGLNSFTAASNSFTGNVGIGTSIPGSKLDVNGNINFTGGVLYQGSPVLQLPTPNGYGTSLGGFNIALGLGALTGSVGFYNTAIGYQALQNDTGSLDTLEGSYNTGIGYLALQTNTQGYNNTGIGGQALQNNTMGTNNIAVGYQAGNNVSGGNSNNIHIGNPGLSGDSSTIRIGTAAAAGLTLGDLPYFQTSFFAGGIRGVTTGNNDAIPVMIDSAGQLGTVSSSRRYKEDIQDMGEASRDLMRLRPVTFRYKKAFADGSKPVQYGLIAEEVNEVYPDLVAHSADGQIETVKYQVLDSMLLNEVQRQQAEIGAQKEQLRRLEQQNLRLLERLDKLETALGSMSRVSGTPGGR